jgi:uncharacterized membrane protein
MRAITTGFIFAAALAGILMRAATGGEQPASPQAAAPAPTVRAQPKAADAAAGDFPEVQHIVTDRCLFCHTGVQREDNLNPTFQAPKGIVFDTPQQIVRFAPQIMAFAVTSKAMPPGNATHMTDEERQKVGAWIEAGAKLP